MIVDGFCALFTGLMALFSILMVFVMLFVEDPTMPVFKEYLLAGGFAVLAGLFGCIFVKLVRRIEEQL